ncbi:MAG: baseplate J/gp47 family protein [Peptostreptococcaceae bacterium]|jgi:hypothetical protein|nr:baseplate J/gp47 family protein [Peptostreptococcaceae bacterium]
MLDFRNLDDKNFDEIFNSMKEISRNTFRKWSDENFHDPGITILEMLAWLNEMQRYYMNRIPNKNIHMFLKLMKEELASKIPSSTIVSFSNESGLKKQIPKCTPLKGSKDVFETTEVMDLNLNELDGIFSKFKMEIRNLEEFNNNEDSHYYPFSINPENKNRLYLGFKNPILKDKELVINIFTGNYILDENLKDEYIVDWYYFVGSGWKKAEIIKDNSFGFKTSGNIHLKIDEDIIATKLYPKIDKNRYWIYAQINKDGALYTPKIKSIGINRVNVINKHFKVKSKDVYYKKEIYLDEYIDIIGINEIYSLINDKYYKIPNIDNKKEFKSNLYYKIEEVKNRYKKLVLIGEDGQEIKDKEALKIKIISYYREEDLFLGYTNPLPLQEIPFYKENSIKHELKLLVGDENDGYYEYKYVDFFSNENKGQNVFTLENKNIVFSDGIKGNIPRKEMKIYLSNIAFSSGKKGNIRRKDLAKFLYEDSYFDNIKLKNISKAIKGNDEQDITDVNKIFAKSLLNSKRAVNEDDYVRLLKKSKELSIGRIKVIPLYEKGLKSYPKKVKEGVLSIVVIPKDKGFMPEISNDYLNKVKKYIEPYRLITTNVKVIKPEYIGIDIKVVANVKDNITENIKEELLEKLEDYLIPIKKEKNKYSGWEFGKTLYSGEIYSLINAHKKIDYVEDLWIYPIGKYIKQDKNKDIYIPKEGLFYLNSFEIEYIRA